MRIKRFTQILLVVVALLITGCGNLTPTPTLVVSLTPTVAPTVVSAPSPTPVPTLTGLADGDRLTRESQFQAAETVYRQVLQAHVPSVDAYAHLSYLLSLQPQREDDALAEASKAVELDPNSAIGQAFLANAYLATGDASAALEAANKAVALDPDNATAQAFLAVVLLQDAQFEAALEAAQRAVNLDATSDIAHDTLGLTYLHTGDLEAGRQALQRAIALAPQFAPYHVHLAYAQVRARDYSRAIAAAERAQALAPGWVPALLALAYAYQQQGAYDDATAILQQAGELAPEEPDVHVARGYLALAQEDIDAALEHFDRAIEQEAENVAAHQGVGLALYADGDCGSAADAFQKAIAIEPKTAWAHLGLGLSMLCDFEPDGLNELQRAAELDPYDPDLFVRIGQTYESFNDWRLALGAHRRATRLDPENPQALAGLGSAYSGLNQYGEAIEALKDALAIDPDNVKAHTELGLIYFTLERDQEARKHFEAALSADPEEATSLALLGALEVEAGNPDQAIDHLQAARQLNPDNALAYYYLGLAHRDLGQYAKAASDLQDYLHRAPSDEDTARIQALQAALETGYVLTESEAIDALQQVLEPLPVTSAGMAVVDTDAGRQLRVALIIEDPEDLRTQQAIGVALGAGALEAPRITPAPEAGYSLELEGADEIAWARLQVPVKLCRRWADGLADVRELFGGLVIEDLSVPAGRDLDGTIARVAEAMNAQRELPIAEDVSYRTMDRQGLRARLEDKIKERSAEERRIDREVLIILDLIDPDVNLEQVTLDLHSTQVLGFYDPETDEFVLVEEDEILSPEDELTLAHEYVHALQDAAFDLETMRAAVEDKGDANLALAALVEGDATLAMLKYAQENLTFVQQLHLFTEASLALSEEELQTAPRFLQEQVQFPYQAGAEFVATLFVDHGGWDAVNAAFENPPETTEQILHPEKYIDGEGPVAVEMADLTQVLDDGWVEKDADTLGEFGLNLVLSQFLDQTTADEATAGWGGDQYSFLERPTDGRDIFVLVTAWDTRADAREFFDAYAETMPLRGAGPNILKSERHRRLWRQPGSLVYLERKENQVRLIIVPDQKTLEVLVEIGGF